MKTKVKYLNKKLKEIAKKYLLVGFVFSALFFVILFLPKAVYAATYYVDKASIGGSCSDSNAGTSLTAPLCTIKQANQMVSPGDNVFIRAGTYTENSGHSAIIDPRMSGSASNYITYKNYNGENVVIGGVYQPILLGYPGSWTRDYIIVDGIKVDGVSQASSPIDIFAFVYGNHNIIRNCVMQYTRINSDWWKGIYVAPGSSYNQIINNTIRYVGTLDPTNQGANIGDSIWSDGDHTLIEGNNISYCGHDCLLLRGSYSIARNNDLHSHRGRTSAIHSDGTSNAHLVFENNIVRDSGGFTPGPCAAYGMQADSAYQIIRNNLFYNNHGHGLELWGMAGAGTSKNSRVYNNVMFGNGNNINGDVPQNEGYGIDLNFISETNIGDFSGIMMKNNILYKNRYVGVNYKGSTDPSRHFEINNFEDTDGTPAFINEASYDFHLNSNSACINKGAWLTTTTNAGSGTSIPVVDAGYFIDGFGIVDGDIIQLQGQTQTARITNIDYNNNIITVNTSLTWSSGVALSYSGSAPDIGAYEYVLTDTTPPTISNDQATNITANSATITWTTDENSDSQVEYGLTISYGSQTTLDPSMVTSHSVLVSGLSPSTLYHYRVKSKDAAGNLATSGDYNFTTSSVPALSGNVSGWAWSETIGWISFNCTDRGICGTSNYGVNINSSTGDFSGYAWAGGGVDAAGNPVPTLGWISFNRADTGNPLAAPYNGGSGPIANFDFATKRVRGWARALANGGGWDGWIKLGDDSGAWPAGGSGSQVNIPAIAGPDEFRGWAWGSDVVGWISFNCLDRAAGFCAGTSNYKVLLDINFPPTATCKETETWNSCVDSRNPALSWNYSDSDSDDQDAYQIQIDNDSAFSAPITIDVTADPSSSNTYQPSGTTLNWGTRYYWRVKVKDNQLWAISWSKSDTAPFNNYCFFDTPAHAYPNVKPPNYDFIWAPQNPSALEPVQFTDRSICYDDVITGSPCSSPDDGFKWTIPKTTQGDPLITFVENPVATFSQPGNWQVILEVTDDLGTCSAPKSVKVSYPLPSWKEIIPR